MFQYEADLMFKTFQNYFPSYYGMPGSISVRLGLWGYVKKGIHTVPVPCPQILDKLNIHFRSTFEIVDM